MPRNTMKTASALAVILSLSGGAQAAVDGQDGSLANFEPVIVGSTLELELGSMGRSIDVDGTKGKAWSQGTQLDFQSGYFADVVGFDLSQFNSFRLGSDEGMETSLLRRRTTGTDESYAKTAASLKFKLGDFAQARLGRFEADETLIVDEYELQTPALVEGVSAAAALGSYSVSALHVRSISDTVESGYDRVQSLTDISAFSPALASTYEVENSSINILSARYAEDGVYGEASYGLQKDVVSRFYLNAGYQGVLTADVDFNVDARYMQTSLNGDLEKEAKGVAEEKQDYSWYSLQAEAESNGLTVGLAYQAIGDDSVAANNSVAVRDLLTDGWAGYTGNKWQGAVGGIYSDFNEQDQKSYQISMDYDATAYVEGLRLNAKYIRGKKDDLRETEYNFGFEYDVPAVENLSLAAVHATNKSELRTPEKVKAVDNRIELIYTLALL